jgi:hypothetical protein
VIVPAWRRLGFAGVAALMAACGPGLSADAGTVAAPPSAGQPSTIATSASPTTSTTGASLIRTSTTSSDPTPTTRQDAVPTSGAIVTTTTPLAPTSAATSSPASSGSERAAATGDATTTTATTRPGRSTRRTSTTTQRAGELPGERVTGFGPRAGRELAVFGIAHDEVLDVLAVPGADEPVVAELAPLDGGVTATGHTRRLRDQSVWHEVEIGGVTGWARSGNLFYLGPSNDLTSFVVRRHGRYPEADTMIELGVTVANVLTDARSATLVVPALPAGGGASDEITLDLGSIEDDSVWGWRLHILGEPPVSGDGIRLRSVEAIDFCLRAGSPDELCA